MVSGSNCHQAIIIISDKGTTKRRLYRRLFQLLLKGKNSKINLIWGHVDMAKKYYAVRIGKTPGIYLTWDDCKAMVDGYPGAKYKSFSNIEEAECFIRGVEYEANSSSLSAKDVEQPYAFVAFNSQLTQALIQRTYLEAFLIVVAGVVAGGHYVGDKFVEGGQRAYKPPVLSVAEAFFVCIHSISCLFS
jgi:hypothetical protein